jgi:hypothetical protein
MADIVIPFSAAFSMVNGSGELEVAQQQSFIWSSNADLTVSADMSLDAFKDAFKLTQETVADNVVLNVEVDASGATAFKNALTASLAAAVNGSSVKIGDWLVGEAETAIDLLIANNGIPAAYEASSIKNLALNNFDGTAEGATLADSDCSQGAANMWTAIGNASADQLRLIALQLPPTKYPTTWPSGTVRLPVADNDTVLFRFAIPQTYVISEDDKDLVDATDPAHTNGNAPNIVAGEDGPSNMLGYTKSHTVDLLVTLKA